MPEQGILEDFLPRADPWQRGIDRREGCDALRMLRVGDRPLRLLRRVSGIDLVPLPDAEVCCGFGGTFAVKNADTSTAMLADKMRNVLGTRAGRERYEQITTAFSSFWNDPSVKKARGEAKKNADKARKLATKNLR